MVPEVVNRLISFLSKENDIVLDPFCGSGTIVLEATQLNRKCIGIDINPLAIKIARAKTTILDPDLLSQEYPKILKLVQNQANFNNYQEIKADKFIRNLEWIERWFKPEIQEKLFRLENAIKTIDDIYIRNFFEIVFSNTARNVSNNRNSSYKNYRMSERDLENYCPDVNSIFMDNFQRGYKGMQELYNTALNRPNLHKPIIKCANILDIGKRKNSIDLILSSPPYGDSSTTVAYGQFSKFSRAWLENITENTVDREGLGGKETPLSTIFSSTFYQIKDNVKQNELEMRNKRHLALHYFYNDFQKVLLHITSMLKPNGFICLVIGNRTMREVRIPMDIITKEILIHIGFEHWLSLYRNIPNKRHPRTQKLYVDPKWLEAKKLDKKPVKIDNIQKESIIILKKRV
ncbi:MAG: DNA methyltransferase [Candidatus Kariarchaeaceae archaeon]|jgi:DNA modification methylase